MQQGLFTRPYVVRHTQQEDPRLQSVNLEQLIKELANVARRLPVTSSCSVSNGAEELYAFIIILQSCLELCEEYLAEYDSLKEDKRTGTTHQRREPYRDYMGRSAEPWKTHNHNTWLERHRQLWRLMVECKDQLLHEQPMYEYEEPKAPVVVNKPNTDASRNEDNSNKQPKAAPKQGKHQRLMDLCFVLVCNILQCCYAVATESMVRSYNAYMPPACIVEAGLLLNRESSVQPVEINHMPGTMLFDHLYHLMSSWNELRYSDDLRYFVTLLELRASFLVTCAHSSLECDAPSHQHELAPVEPGELEADAMIRERFAMNLNAVGLLMAAFLGFHERLYFATRLSAATDTDLLPPPYSAPDDNVERQQRFDRVRKWILDGASVEQTAIPSGFIRRAYAEAALWPSERLLYQLDRKRENAGVTHTVVALTVMRKSRAVDSTDVTTHPLLRAKRGLHYTSIVESSETPTASILGGQLPLISSATPGGKESTLLRLALHEYVSNQVNKIFEGQLKWDVYAIMSENIPYQFEALTTPLRIAKDDDYESMFGEADSMDGIVPKSRYSVYPYMVQLFNHWNLVYGGVVYWVDSYIEALSMWIRIIEVHHNRHIGSLDIAPLINAIFDNQREIRDMQQRLKRAGSRATFSIGAN